MPQTYFSVFLICGTSLLAGRAILAACGREGWSWLEPAVGFGALMTVSGLGARIGGGGTASTALVIALGFASVAGLALHYRGPSGASAGDVIRNGLPVAAVAVLILSIPFAVSGRWGLIGVGVNNDLGLHLAWTEWLRSGFGPKPEGGYPLGPHGLAIAVAAFPRVGLGQAFVGEVMSISVLTALTTLAALRSLGTVRRTTAAVLVAVFYLAASYYAQAAFKETAEALFVLAFALFLPSVTPLPPGGRAKALAVAPLVVLCTGIFFSYSFAGLAWPIGIAGLWCLAQPSFRAALRPRKVLRLIATPWTLAWIAGLGAAVVFLGFVGPYAFADGFSSVASSNTYGPVSPFEALGVWPTANYRIDGAGSVALPVLFAAVGVIAVLASLAWWLRRRETAVPVAVAACVVLYLVSLPSSGDYSQAKALMIGSPLIALLVFRALLSPLDVGVKQPAAGGRGQRASSALRVAWVTLGVAVVACAAYSSFLVLRETSIGPPGYGAELTAFRAELQGKNVLYAGQDRYAAYGLQGADTDVPVVEFPDPDVEESPTKPFDTGDAYSPIDFDSFTYFTLNHHKYVVTGRAAWNSQPPRNFEKIAKTDSYNLWRSEGKTPQNRSTLLEFTEAAAPVRCASPETKIFIATKGRASVFGDPVVFGPKERWDDGRILHTGEDTAQMLDLPAGKWNLSMQYFSPVGMTLEAPGFGKDLKAALDGQRPDTISLANDGQYWPAGKFTQGTSGPVEFRVHIADPSTLQELTGYDGRAFVGNIVATRDAPRETLPLARTCGRWIDWYTGQSPP